MAKNNNENTSDKHMEDLKKKSTTESDKEIVYSKAIKAGKRIYYLDVKKNRKEKTQNFLIQGRF